MSFIPLSSKNQGPILLNWRFLKQFISLEPFVDHAAKSLICLLIIPYFPTCVPFLYLGFQFTYFPIRYLVCICGLYFLSILLLLFIVFFHIYLFLAALFYWIIFFPPLIGGLIMELVCDPFGALLWYTEMSKLSLLILW